MTIETIEPVRKSIHVKAPLQHAFDVFTAGLTRWWPLQACTGGAPVQKVLMEPKLGGRWLEIAGDGTERVVATVALWEPPHRLVLVWQVNAQFKSDPSARSEVEVRFTPDGNNGTLVELTHHHFESMGVEDGTKLRDAVGGGWPKMLALFATAAEAEMAEAK